MKLPTVRMSTKHPVHDDLIERLRQQKTILLDFARVAAEATDAQRLLSIACEHMARATGVNHTKVLQYRSEAADLKMMAGRGFKPGVIDHALLAIDMASAPGRCYQTRNVVNVGDIRNNPEYRYEDVLKEHGIVSVLHAPVSIDGVVWGVIETDSTAPDAFDEDDEQFLLAMGVVLGLAIRHRQAQEMRAADAEKLGRQLAQADMLIGEQNHRVRNYFQMILSLLGARSTAAANQQSRAEYLNLMERVSAIGLAHDLLRIDKGQSVVNAATYLEALCGGMERSLGVGPKISRELESMELRADRAVPLGLVTNELLTNCFKHAGMDRPDSAISVRLSTDHDSGEAVLNVSDNGPGIKQRRPGSQGLKLVRSFAGQLSGRIEVETSDSGTSVTMRFPLIE